MDSKEFVRYCELFRYYKYSTVCNNITNYTVSLVGQGDYGTAFLLNDGKIGKIYKSWDAAYIAFLELVSQSANPHLPTIFNQGHCNQFSYVVLEFLTPLAAEVYMKMNFSQVSLRLKDLILGKKPKVDIPNSLRDLGLLMRKAAKGFCLDFKEENFGMRNDMLVTFDPFTLKTKNNTHLEYVSKDGEKKR